MVNIEPWRIVTPKTKQDAKVERVSPAVSSRQVEEAASPALPVKERRKKNDRRQDRSNPRDEAYDMRGRKGRRKDDPGQPKIDIDI